MAEEIQKKYPKVEVECEPGSGGIFEITVDDKTIFSKKETGRFPQKGEIIGLLEGYEV